MSNTPNVNDMIPSGMPSKTTTTSRVAWESSPTAMPRLSHGGPRAHLPRIDRAAAPGADPALGDWCARVLNIACRGTSQFNRVLVPPGGQAVVARFDGSGDHLVGLLPRNPRRKLPGAPGRGGLLRCRRPYSRNRACRLGRAGGGVSARVGSCAWNIARWASLVCGYRC